MTQMIKFSHVIYHANCSDGFTGAWVAWLRLGEGTEYIPRYFAGSPAKLPPDAVAIMIDCAYPREEVLTLRTKVKKLIVLDHHQTNMEDLKDLPDVIFDMARSGAMLAWNYFHPGIEPPPLVKYVQDRDLWKKVLPKCDEIASLVGSMDPNMANWSKLSGDLAMDFDRMAAKGEAILQADRKHVKQICGLSYMRDVGGYTVPVVNTAIFLSDVGHELCKRHPEAPFAACYFETPEGKRRWSLRSMNGFDCSTVAKKFGGGGHAAACAFVEQL